MSCTSSLRMWCSAFFARTRYTEMGNRELNLQRIHSRVGNRKTGIRDVNVLQSNAEIPIRTRVDGNVQPDPRLRRKVDAVCAVGNVVVREQHTASEFEIRNCAME